MIFITSEIGINHNGNLEITKKLIDIAKLCGCDAIKLQKRTVEKVYTKEFLDSLRDSPWGKTQRDQKMGLEFSKVQYDEIAQYCLGKIDWYASAWDMESQKFLRQYNLKYNKIASPMALDMDLVFFVAEEQKQTFISTGKVNFDQLDAIVDLFKGYKCPFTLMHCVLKYPCPDEICRLKGIGELKQRYNCPVGYSNHNPSILVPSLAVAFGAEALEIHITEDRTMYGSDQAASFEMMGLYYVVRDAQRVRSIIE